MTLTLEGIFHASRQLTQYNGESNIISAADTQILLTSGYMVFFMQCGFAMLSAGSVRAKNAKNIVLKILLDACFGALGWYATGYAFAYGNGTGNAFISHGNFFLSELGFNGANSQRNDDPKYDRGQQLATWFFQYAFSATAATIVSGAVAERCKFEAYLAYTSFLTMWVYPVLVHWVWSDQGWLSPANTNPNTRFLEGSFDFAGCGVVHMTGGLGALAGAWVLGPRLGRFNAKRQAQSMPGHNSNLAILGVFILWFGWFGFNPGSALGMSGSKYQVGANCAVTTTLSAAAATMSTLILSMLLEYRKTKQVVWDIVQTSNGTLAGLVSITSACAVVHPWQAIVIGLIGGIVYTFASILVLHVLKVDDPLDAVAVHLFCGMWGLLAAGIFPSATLVEGAYGFVVDGADGIKCKDRTDVGDDFICYNRGRVFGANFVALIVISAWVLGWMIPFFIGLKLAGLFRVSPEEEHEGLDSSHHGGSAYPDDPTQSHVSAGISQIVAEKINRLELQVKELQAANKSEAPAQKAAQ